LKSSIRKHEKKHVLSALKIVLFDTCRTPVLDGFFDLKLTNRNVSLTASMSM